MSDKMIGIYVARYNPETDTLISRERVRGHTLESEAALTVRNTRRGLDEHCGYRVEVWDEDWDGQTLVGSKKRG